jgi:hypothetical protein
MHVLAEAQDPEWLTSRVEKLRIRASSAGLTEAEQNLVFSRIPGYGRIAGWWQSWWAGSRRGRILLEGLQRHISC